MTVHGHCVLVQVTVLVHDLAFRVKVVVVTVVVAVPVIVIETGVSVTVSLGHDQVHTEHHHAHRRRFRRADRLTEPGMPPWRTSSTLVKWLAASQRRRRWRRSAGSSWSS
jgi:hypothetical protein